MWLPKLLALNANSSKTLHLTCMFPGIDRIWRIKNFRKRDVARATWSLKFLFYYVKSHKTDTQLLFWQKKITWQRYAFSRVPSSSHLYQEWTYVNLRRYRMQSSECLDLSRSPDVSVAAARLLAISRLSTAPRNTVHAAVLLDKCQPIPASHITHCSWPANSLLSYHPSSSHNETFMGVTGDIRNCKCPAKVVPMLKKCPTLKKQDQTRKGWMPKKSFLHKQTQLYSVYCHFKLVPSFTHRYRWSTNATCNATFQYK